MKEELQARIEELREAVRYPYTPQYIKEEQKEKIHRLQQLYDDLYGL